MTTMLQEIPGPGGIDSDTAQAVLRADDARHAAMVAHDLPALSALLGDALLYTHSTGRRETKRQYLESLTNGRVRYVALQRRDAQLQAYGSAVLMQGSSTIRAITQGELKSVSNLFLSVWAKSDAVWKMVAWTSVLLPAAPLDSTAAAAAPRIADQVEEGTA